MMRELMKFMAYESGHLVEVECFYPSDLPTDIGFIKRGFQQGSYFVVATDDDSLKLTDSVAEVDVDVDDFNSVNMSDKLPWQSAIGRSVRWVWTMVNQQGYLDGLQFEFANNITQEPVVIQLIAIASSIKLYKRISLSQRRIGMHKPPLKVANHDSEEILMEAA